MLKTVLRVLTVVVTVAAAGAAGLFLYGPERVWATFAGSADLGPIQFSTLERRTSPNDALACSPDACPASTQVDTILPVYAQSPAATLVRLDKVLADDTDVTRVDDRARPTYRRYVARTPILRFPDTIDVEALPAPDGGTLLRLYSRSQLGRGDFGVNAARLRDWTQRLERSLRASG